MMVRQNVLKRVGQKYKLSVLINCAKLVIITFFTIMTHGVSNRMTDQNSVYLIELNRIGKKENVTMQNAF